MTRPTTTQRLAHLTTLRLGGPARHLVTAGTDDELVAAVTAADDAGDPLLILGGGSNVVVADEGWPGTVVTVRTRGIRRDGARWLVAAGEPWDDFVAATVAAGHAGVECLSGIPGSVGATPIQNVGAYGQDVAEVIRGVRVLDRTTGRQHTVSAEECGFGYRDSVFKRTPQRWLVLAVAYQLSPSATSRPIRYRELAERLGGDVGDSRPLADVRRAVLDLRRGKGMVLDPDDPDTYSAGSFFTNPIVTGDVAGRLPAQAPRYPAPGGVKLSAAWLIEHAGFGKGFAVGPRAAVSGKHSLALTNRGQASTAELLELARVIRAGVAASFGVTLVPEPVLVGCRL